MKDRFKQALTESAGLSSRAGQSRSPSIPEREERPVRDIGDVRVPSLSEAQDLLTERNRKDLKATDPRLTEAGQAQLRRQLADEDLDLAKENGMSLVGFGPGVDTYCGKTADGETVMVRYNRTRTSKYDVTVGSKTVASKVGKDAAAAEASKHVAKTPWNESKEDVWAKLRRECNEIIDKGQKEATRQRLGVFDI